MWNRYIILCIECVMEMMMEKDCDWDGDESSISLMPNKEYNNEI